MKSITKRLGKMDMHTDVCVDTVAISKKKNKKSHQVVKPRPADPEDSNTVEM